MLYLIIEFLDELVFGVTEAAWPYIQEDLALTYTQVGILLTVPGIFSSIIEPFLGILGDFWKRRLLVLGGGIFFVAALILTSISQIFVVLLIAFTIFYPASGAFVNLSQATLMDEDPNRHDLNMARWTFAGSLGVVLGPLLLLAIISIGFGWRSAFAALGLFALFVLAFTWVRYPRCLPVQAIFTGRKLLSEGFRTAIKALRKTAVIRWLILLEFSDLMLDVLLGFLALYFHDVVGLSESHAAGAVFVWLLASLVGDFLIIPVLKRVDGLRYLRWSVILELLLFPAFLLVNGYIMKLVIAGFLGLFNAGWYAILQGRLYSTMPGQSGLVMTLTNVSGLFGSMLPFAVGLVADSFGLQNAMWLLLLGPIALMLGLPLQRTYQSGGHN